MIVAKKLKLGFSMTNCRKSTNCWTKYYLFLYIWTNILHPLKKSKVTDGSSNQNCAYKTDGIIFSKCIPPSNLEFDPIWGVSIKIYLLPGFTSYTFETYMNLQLKSPCRSVQRVLSEFLTKFSVNRVLIFQKLINFNLFHTIYFWKPQKVLSWSCMEIKRLTFILIIYYRFILTNVFIWRFG